MTDLSVGRVEGSNATKRHEAARSRRRRIAGSLALSVFVVGNAVAMLWIWGAGGSDGIGYHWHSFDAALLSLGRITALLAGYLALVEVLLLARLPFLERLVGFDRLTHWHRWNGHAVLDLVLAHVVFSVWGYAKLDKQSWFQEYWNWLTLPQPGGTKIGGLAGGAATQSGSLGFKAGSLGTGTAGDGDVSLPGDHHRDDRHRLADRRRRHLAGRRAPKTFLRVVVCDPLHGVRGDRARVVPHDPRRQRVRDRQDRHRLLAQPLRARGCTRPLLPRRTTARTRRSLRPASDRGQGGGAWCRLAPDRRPRPQPAQRPGGPVLLLALPHPGVLVHPAPVLALRSPERGLVADHRQEPRRPQLEVRPDPGRDTRLRRRPIRCLHRSRARSPARRS